MTMVNASLIFSAPEQLPFAKTSEHGTDLEVQRSDIQEVGQKQTAEIGSEILGVSKKVWRGKNSKLSEPACLGSHHPGITRSWSFVDPSGLKSKNPSLSINLSREPERSRSSKKISWSPIPRDDPSSILELLNCSEEMQQGLIEVLKANSPVVSVKELENPVPVGESTDGKPITFEQLVLDEEPKQQKQQIQDYKVKPIARLAVPASAPPETNWILLSNLDRVVNPTFSSVVHFYENVITDRRAFQDTTRSLKEALARTLVDFYPLAGRLQLREDGKVDLRCNNKGAVWIEAVVEASLEEVGGARPNHLLSGIQTARLGNGPIYSPDQLTDVPVLIIQVTKFKCGSIAIATSWHHTVADGSSGMHFMLSWSEVALGKPISVKPVHTREILKPREPLNPTLVTGYSTKSILEESYDGMAVNTSEVAKLETFDLNATAIADLKRQANLVPPPFTPRPYTSAESISGHLWRQMTKARAAANSYDASLAKDQTTKFFMFVDGRKRLQLPSGYFGNVVCSACAVAKEADILNNPLTFAASMIRSATRNITEEYFRSLIDWVELQGTSITKSEHINSLGHDVAATFWTFFPIYDVEFGWGRPIYAARNSPPRPLIDGIAMMPKSDGKGMTALLNLHSDRLSKLERQISFTTVFQD